MEISYEKLEQLNGAQLIVALLRFGLTPYYYQHYSDRIREGSMMGKLIEKYKDRHEPMRRMDISLQTGLLLKHVYKFEDEVRNKLFKEEA